MRLMNSLLHYTITVPLLALPAAIALPKFALAGNPSPVQALELLATSKEIDAKCKQLSTGERQELSDYVARAEIAIARRTSAADAQSAITIGKAKGKAATCNEASQAQVRDMLTAARRAMANLPKRVAENGDGLVIEDKSTVPMRPSLDDQAPPLPLAQPEQSAPKSFVKRFPGHNMLQSYGAAAMAYYVERRCNHLPYPQARAFWNLIVERHGEALANNKRRAVAATLHTAQARADAMSCGAQTAELVKQNYAAIRNP
jgi:hypothetical protein